MNTIDIEYNNGLRLFTFFKDDGNCTQKCDGEEHTTKTKKNNNNKNIPTEIPVSAKLNTGLKKIKCLSNR